MADGRITIDTTVNKKGAEKGLSDLQKSVEGTSKKMKKIGGNMSKYVTAPILAVGGIALKIATDFDNANRQIQQGLNVSADEAEKLTEVANNIYKKGFGQSLEDTSQAVIDVKNNFQDLVDASDLETVTTDAMALAKTLGEDVNWVARAGSTLMREFGEDSQSAFDMIAWGSKNGLNFSEELLDNISEYGPLFADMGYSTQEYFELLRKGADEGAYNLDYLNDTVKEFNVRLNDGTAEEAIGSLSKETQNLFQDWKDGEATTAEVMDAVTGDLSEMDKTAVNAIGPEIFGTKFEDMGADAIIAMGNVEGEIENVDGAMQDITDSQEEAFGQRFQSLIRNTGEALKPTGEILLDIAEEYLPPLIKGVQSLAEWFQDLSPHIQKAMVIFGAIAAVLGPIIVVIGTLVSAISSIMTALGPVISLFKIIGPIIGGVASGPVLLIIGAIGLLITIGVLLWKNWDTVKEKAIEIWGAISQFFSDTWEWIKQTITDNWNTIKETLLNAWTWAKETTEENWNKVKEFFSVVWQSIVGVFKWYIDTVKKNVETAWNWIKETTSKVWNGIKTFFTDLWEKIKSVVKSAVDSVKNKISNVWNTIKSTTSSMWNGIKSTVTGVWDTLKSKVKNAFNTIKDTISGVWDSVSSSTDDIWNGITGSVKSAINGVISAINGMINALNGLSIPLPTIPDWVPGMGGKGGGSISFPNIPNIPSLDVGTNLVKSDGLAMIHKGEQVVPAKHTGPYKTNQEERKIVIQPSAVVMDGREVGTITWEYVDENIQRNNRVKEAFR
ncbi:hypothetical protein Pryu01_02995 [Paraliobacillus ryukyuensis]|uniref:Phage-related minor tail protein n=1 Tax=Paraliobacillus ryukyuensis TaxID=200904 RepID=A0A366DPP3_9BACI|nr:phage tail tape measure protein [Paraliobacillus ryukyuensis]RBO92073.1 phage-related minor tail protein [Paraliobacillus ryukyuensis]